MKGSPLQRGGHSTWKRNTLSNLSPDCECDRQAENTKLSHGLQSNPFLSVDVAYLDCCLSVHLLVSLDLPSFHLSVHSDPGLPVSSSASIALYLLPPAAQLCLQQVCRRAGYLTSEETLLHSVSFLLHLCKAILRLLGFCDGLFLLYRHICL